MATGKITQIIGAVIDVEFPRDSIPKVYEALKLTDVDLTLEVQQQLGDGVVRTIAMGASEGLKRGLAVESTGAPISVPVGSATLGRIMDVLGAPQDNRGPVASKEKWSIHRPAPSYDEQAGGQDDQQQKQHGNAIAANASAFKAGLAGRIVSGHLALLDINAIS